jgi:basic amino acid/polyamine antiporter, APA family
VRDAAEPERRPVGPIALLALGVNGIVGAGIFFVPADVAAHAPGRASIAVFALTALALAPVAAAFALLGSRFHEDGGPVVFARAAFGKWPGFIVGWIAYVSALASTSAVTAGLAGGLRPGASPEELAHVATALVTALAAAVALGIVFSARTWTILTALKLAPLLLLAAVFAASPSVIPSPSSAAVTTAAASIVSWAPAGLFAMFALQGFEIVPVIAGQARAPARSVPMATLGSLALAAGLYVVLQAACVAAVPGLATSAAPLAAAGAALGGPALGRVIAVGTNVSALGICFGMMVTTPRYLSALAAGEGLAVDVHRMSGRGVPLRALALTWAFVVLLVETGTRTQLFAFSSVAVLMQYGVTAAALAALSWRRDRGLRPAYVWVAVPALAVAVVLGSGATIREVTWASAALTLGLLLRWVAHVRGTAASPPPRS